VIYTIPVLKVTVAGDKQAIPFTIFYHSVIFGKIGRCIFCCQYENK